MSESAQQPPSAWEPLTPQGVAAFATATVGRLLVVQFIVGLLAAGVVVWTLHEAWCPVVWGAVRGLPAAGEIRGRQLEWPGESPTRLAGNHFLALSVDLHHSGQLGREAHLQVEFGRKDLRVLSLVHYWVVEYPPGWRIAFNRTELDPWWGAWEPGILAGAGLVTVVGVMLSWTLLATLYCVPARVIAFLEDRDLTLGQSWRMSGAALMPGALFFSFAIFSYGLGLLDLIQLGVLDGLHLLIGWVYLLIGPLFLPKSTLLPASKANPFAGSREAKAGEK